MTLEDRLRALAAKGELTYLSVIPQTHKGVTTFSATYATAKTRPHSFGVDADPVAAIQKALDSKNRESK